MGVDWLRDVMDHQSSNYIKRITALRLSSEPGTYICGVCEWYTCILELCWQCWDAMQHVPSRWIIKNIFAFWLDCVHCRQAAFPSCLSFLPFPSASPRRRLSVPRPALLFGCPSPHGQESTPIPAALPKNKRESVRRHPLDLFHAPAPTPLPDGAAFFQGLSEPQESSKMDAPLPLSPLYSCPSSTCSLCHAPMPRARPLPRPTLAASSIQIVNHLLAMALLQDIIFFFRGGGNACETVCNEAVLLHSTESTFDFKWQPKKY